jgi:hypothetical protein
VGAGSRRAAPPAQSLGSTSGRAGLLIGDLVGSRAVLDGLPAAQVGPLDAAPPRPASAFEPTTCPPVSLAQ